MSNPYQTSAPFTLQGTGIGSVCRAIIGATPVYNCPAGYSAQSAGCVSTATNGTADVNDTVVGRTTDRGYTEHEELDELGIIHMNGRIYDPYIGRFMSADPFIQAPYELQSHNRYAYVMNNPLLYTDPSGFNWFKKLVSAAVILVAVVVTMGAVAVAVGAASSFSMVATAWAGATLGQAMVIGAAGGFVGGFLGAALNGASFGDSLKAGVIGGITGAAMAWAGGIGGVGEAGSNSAARYMAHGPWVVVQALPVRAVQVVAVEVLLPR